jgi:CheY-like chemotaxis protein
LTARSQKEDRERCLAAGMDDYLSKPVRTAELFAAMERLICNHGYSEPASADAGPRTDLVDATVLLGTCGDDADGLRELCQDFQTYVPPRMAAINDALQNQDAPRLREAAHKLCGLLGAFSTVAGKMAGDLEDHAAGGRLDDARPLVRDLGSMVAQLIHEVNGITLESLHRQAERARATIP